MIEFKISCWIVEIYVVLLGSDKIMFILKNGFLELYYYMLISIEIYCISIV